MSDADHRTHDRLSPRSVHDLLTLLTVIRGQEHMVRRWVRLRDDSDGYDGALDRLDVTDALIMQLAAEVIARETQEPGDDENPSADRL